MAGGRTKGDGRGRLGGRAAGTPNKCTQELRDILKPLVIGYCTDGIGETKRKLISDLECLEPEKRTNVMLGFLPFVCPRLSNVSLSNSVKETFKDELDRLENS